MSSRFFAASYDSDSDEEESLVSTSEEELLSSSEESGGDSSDELLDDDDDDEDDEDEDDDDKVAVPNKFLKSEPSSQRSVAYFLKGSNIPDSDDESSSEEEDDNKKVVKSAKEKLLGEIKNTTEEIENASNLDDWITVSKEFDKLNKLITKSSQQNIPTPVFYIKTIAELEDEITAVSKENPKMNGVTSKAFNSIKQRVRKSIREHEREITKFRENPDDFENEDSEEPASLVGTPFGKPLSVPTEAIQEEELDIPTTLRMVIENRGKKNADRYEQVTILENLLQSATNPFQFILIYLLLIPTRFDFALNTTFMPIEQWTKTEADIRALLNILETNPKYRVSETVEVGLDFEVEPEANSEGFVDILGSISSFVERLDDELTRSLLVIDPHTSEYIQRLRDETKLYTLILRSQVYIESLSKDLEKNEQLFRIILRRIDHLYFKPIELIQFNEKTAWNAIGKDKVSLVSKRPETFDKSYGDNLLNTLCSLIYRQSKSVYRKRAMLCHIYYYAYNSQYYKARDMMLMSHLQSTIHSSEASLQVLFNRTLVQLGLCAFKLGLIEESLQTLQEIATSARQRELLGQGIQRYQQQQQYNSSSVAADKQRLLPFHMHINLELLEAVFLTASLLVEIPQYAQLGNAAINKKLAVKSFRRALEFHEKQHFQGPPENTKDFIMHAAKYLQLGEWKKATNYIKSIEVWKLFGNPQEIKKMIEAKLQVEGLRTYLFQFRTNYAKLSIHKLSEIFELSESKVSSILSKMIFNEEIFAALDQKTSSIYFIHGHELNKTQELALTLAEKVGQLAEKNERLAAGGHQQSQQQSQSHHNNHNNTNNNASSHNHSQNFKISSNTNGIIAGALNGMEKRGRRRN